MQETERRLTKSKLLWNYIGILRYWMSEWLYFSKKAVRIPLPGYDITFAVTHPFDEQRLRFIQSFEQENYWLLRKLVKGSSM